MNISICSVGGDVGLDVKFTTEISIDIISVSFALFQTVSKIRLLAGI
jgi:hypothetical protein